MLVANMQLQIAADTRRWFGPYADDFHEQVIGMVGEAGEALNILKKIRRDGDSRQLRIKLAQEITDTLYYAFQALTCLEEDVTAQYIFTRAECENRFGGARKEDGGEKAPLVGRERS